MMVPGNSIPSPQIGFAPGNDIGQQELPLPDHGREGGILRFPWGALLILSGILTLGATFAEIASTELVYPSRHWTAWQIHSNGAPNSRTYEQLDGVALVVSGVLIVVAGLLAILVRVGDRRSAPTVAAVASGLSVGVTATTMFAAESYGSSSAHPLARHAGYWLLLAAALVAATAMAIGITAKVGRLGTVRDRYAAIVFAGVLLLASAIAAIGSVPDQWQDPPAAGMTKRLSLSAWHLDYSSATSGRTDPVELGVPLLLAAFLGILCAGLLLTPIALRTGFVRTASASAAGLIFGVTLTVVLDTTSHEFLNGGDVGSLRSGAWMLMVAAALSAIAIGLVLWLPSRPRPEAT
ncbi:hypothetical protein ACFXHA_06825 [Nocardia sp. NPDC059240]|uniref:hypothetical protein n=1 Tax=Nocardia sp. NPDC059240 TaxID=3346786 RepID=UPI00368A379D